MIRLALSAVISLFLPMSASAEKRWGKIAVVTGELIGANAGCGIPNERLVRLGRHFIREIDAAATSEKELELARETHEGAVATVAHAVKRYRERVCPAAEAALARAEQACLPPAGPDVCLAFIEARP